MKLFALSKRVIQVSIADTFHELKKSGKTPVCLFSKRKACDSFNAEMLLKLTAKVHELVCTDEITRELVLVKLLRKQLRT